MAGYKIGIKLSEALGFPLHLFKEFRNSSTERYINASGDGILYTERNSLHACPLMEHIFGAYRRFVERAIQAS